MANCGKKAFFFLCSPLTLIPGMKEGCFQRCTYAVARNYSVLFADEYKLAIQRSRSAAVINRKEQFKDN